MLLKNIFISIESEPITTTPSTAPAAETPAPKPAEAELTEEKVPAPAATPQPVYTWVSKLNVRAEPTTSSEVVTTVTPGQPLQPTGMRSDLATAITLRGNTFNDIWHEVTAPDGKKGWVYGGTIQPPDHGTKNIIQPLSDYQKCPLVGGANDPMDGCSCNFYTDDKKATSVFDASFSGRVCVTIDGNTYQLDGWYDGYSYLPDSPHPWINLGDKESTLFGEKHSFDYEKTVHRLTEALLSYDKIPTEIPIENNMTGMFVREVRDMAADAIAAAKKRRAAGERNGDARMEYANDKYRVILTGNTYKGTSDTGTDYEALLQVLDAKSGKVLERLPVRGHCGC